ncbi:MAG TPA: SLATT domain-containing protein [Methylomirabilota bacterium]|nr:SLATT domain-containing protein [Methylomirabilota bacterium]
MDENQPASDTQQRNEHFISALKELTAIKDTYIVKNKIQWYKKHIERVGIFFRLSGVLVIILSVSLPFFTTLEGFWKTTILPFVALLIAALTGLNAFFQWQSDWSGSYQAHIALEHLLSIWELRITEAKQETNVQEAIQKALKATEQLLDGAKEIAATETEGAFKNLQFPRSQQS